MAEEFDPYHKWLGIPPHERPPSHYRLLGVAEFETDGDVIANAADRQMAHLRTFQSGKFSAESQRLLNEVAAAKLTLLKADKKAEYDQALRAKIAAAAPAPKPTAARPERGAPPSQPGAAGQRTVPPVTPARPVGPAQPSGIRQAAATGAPSQSGIQRQNPAAAAAKPAGPRTAPPTAAARPALPAAESPAPNVAPTEDEPTRKRAARSPGKGDKSIWQNNNVRAAAVLGALIPLAIIVKVISSGRQEQPVVSNDPVKPPAVVVKRPDTEPVQPTPPQQGKVPENPLPQPPVPPVAPPRTPASGPAAIDRSTLSFGLRVWRYLAQPGPDPNVFLHPSQFSPRMGGESRAASLNPWIYGDGAYAVAFGYLQVDQPGQYGFDASSSGDRNAVYVNGKLVCAYRGGLPGSDANDQRIELGLGFVPIAVVGYPGSNGRLEYVHWIPPGVTSSRPIPDALLLHRIQPDTPKYDVESSAPPAMQPPAIAVNPPTTIQPPAFQPPVIPQPPAFQPPAAPTLVDYRPRFALRFNKGDFVEVQNSAGFVNLDQTFTVEAWVYLAPSAWTSSSETTLFGNRFSHTGPEDPQNPRAQGWHLGISKRFEKLHFTSWYAYGLRNTGYSGSGGDTALGDRWRHIAVTAADKKQFLFVDGVQIKVGQSLNEKANSAQPLRIGKSVVNSTNSFQGDMAAFRISTISRYQPDAPFTPPTTFENDAATLTNLDFSAARGSVIPDSSGNRRHGTISGAQLLDLTTGAMVAGGVTPNAGPAGQPTPPAFQPAGPVARTPKKKPAPPDEAAQAEALKKIKEVFKLEYAQAKKPEEKDALAERMAQQATRAEDDAATQYVMWTESIRLSTEVGKWARINQSIDMLDAGWEVDAITMKSEAILDAAKQARGPDGKKALALTLIGLLDETVQAERFDLATRMAALATSSAVDSKDAELRKKAAAKAADVKRQATEYQSVEKAIETLKTTPDDPAANLTRGRYLCFVKRNWAEGLPLLVKSGDKTLKTVAEQDLAGPTAAADRESLAEAWWEAAEADKSGARDALRARSGYWYRKAITQLSGLKKLKTEKRLDELSLPHTDPDVASSSSGANSAPQTGLTNVPGNLTPPAPVGPGAVTPPAVPAPPGVAGPQRVPKTLSVNLGPDVKIDLRYCPPGAFMMGVARQPGEPLQHAHQVTITKGFYLGLTEVTQEQWSKVAVLPAVEVQDPKAPVTLVSHTDCEQYLAKLSEKSASVGFRFRLPTEAEWEYACRAGTTTFYSFGDDRNQLQQYGWYADHSGGKVHQTGQLLANVWGFFDMHGNASEWCSDWITPNYESLPAVDPTGPATGSQHVLRGGSHSSAADNCSSGSRIAGSPTHRSQLIGFRIALDAEHVIRAQQQGAINPR